MAMVANRQTGNHTMKIETTVTISHDTVKNAVAEYLQSMFKGDAQVTEIERNRKGGWKTEITVSPEDEGEET